MTRRAALGLAVLVALGAAAGAWRWSAMHRAAEVGILVAGGDGGGGGLPRATPVEEGFEEKALAAAVDRALGQGAQAVLVVRHGHLVLDRYAHGADAGTLVAGGELDRVLLRLAAGVAVDRSAMPVPELKSVDDTQLAAAIAGASGQAYPLFLSRHVWRPLDAAPARWLAPGMMARPGDWMRVAGMLLHDGRYEGTQVAPRGWVARLGPWRTPTGAEPFRPGEMAVFHGAGATMLWLSPRLDLSILCVDETPAPGIAPDETRLPRAIVRSLRESPGTGGSSLDDLVPGH